MNGIPDTVEEALLMLWKSFLIQTIALVFVRILWRWGDSPFWRRFMDK